MRLIKAPQPQRQFFTVIPQYERGVRTFLGVYDKVLDPGVRLNLPFLHCIYPVNISERFEKIPQQSLISMDNVTFHVDATVQYKIVHPDRAIFNVNNLGSNLIERCQMEIRNVLSSMEINDILRNRNEVTNNIKTNLKSVEDSWGINILLIQLKEISFDENMRKAMAIKAEADRNAEAKLINATADVETARKYNEAATIYSENPITLRLREFQLWNSVSKNPGTTIYVVPSNILDFMKSIKEK
jgi:regulator of protease activity HflC (stomatin/prohibitin superfamily)